MRAKVDLGQSVRILDRATRLVDKLSDRLILILGVSERHGLRRFAEGQCLGGPIILERPPTDDLIERAKIDRVSDRAVQRHRCFDRGLRIGRRHKVDRNRCCGGLLALIRNIERVEAGVLVRLCVRQSHFAQQGVQGRKIASLGNIACNRIRDNVRQLDFGLRDVERVPCRWIQRIEVNFFAIREQFRLGTVRDLLTVFIKILIVNGQPSSRRHVPGIPGIARIAGVPSIACCARAVRRITDRDDPVIVRHDRRFDHQGLAHQRMDIDRHGPTGLTKKRLDLLGWDRIGERGLARIKGRRIKCPLREIGVPKVDPHIVRLGTRIVIE